MAISDLPEEIQLNILSRLPVKSVGRCRCVVKPWRTLLSTPHFLKTHFTQKPHKENLILIIPSGSIHSIETIGDASAVSKSLDLSDNFIEYVDSCNGLVLLVDKEWTKHLLNPITLEHVKIPNSPLALGKHEGFNMNGFGYDSVSDDYKVVTISCYDYEKVEPLNIDMFVDVYSVKNDVWERVDCSPYDLVPTASGAFLNGAIHWLASKKELPIHSVIAAFNLVYEVFVEIPGPSNLDVTTFVYNKLVVCGGCLCMIDCENSYRSEIWVMGEYGVGDSWTKFCINVNYDWDIHRPLYITEDDEIVLLAEEESLFIYNWENSTLREVLVDGIPAMYMTGGAFVESLVSPADVSMLQLVERDTGGQV